MSLSYAVDQRGRRSMCVENPFFLICLKIMSLRVAGTVSDSDGAVWTIDEEAGTNLVVVADWDLPDIVDLGTTVSLAILER